MENKFQTSFIPKKTFDENGRSRVKTPRNLLHVFSIILFIAALASAGGVFAYNYLLERSVTEARMKLSDKEKDFNYAVVQDIVDFDNQLKTASSVLKGRSAVSELFATLEENTITNLRFTSFEFSYLSPRKVTLSMKGEARTFGAVARQAEAFANSSSTKAYFTNPLFTDLDLDERGTVSFSFLTTIDPDLIAYKATPDASLSSATTTATITTTNIQ